MNCGLPSTNSVYLYSVTPAGGEDAILTLEKYFRNTGYEVHVNLNASVEDLRTLPHDCSIFFFNTHGIYRTQNGKKVFFALQTGTIDTNDSAYDNEKKDGFLGAAGGMDIDGQQHDYLTISNKFIQKYWRFPENSFVFINGCEAFDDNLGEDSIYRSILNICKASVFGGWTNSNVASCDFANNYLFDRLLGANMDEAHRVCPPNRPFDLDSVMKKLSKRLGDVAFNTEDGKLLHTILKVERSSHGDFGILAPSIEYAEIDEGDKTMTIHGLFGSDQSKIRVFIRQTQDKVCGMPGFELSRDSSIDEKTIICRGLPDSGPGSTGYLIVAVDYGNGCLVESNPVPITAWRGKFTYTLRLPGRDSDDELGQITLDAFLRGDIHRSREEPDGDPQPRYCVFANVRDEANPAHYTSGGAYTDAQGNTYNWHGSGKMKAGVDGPGGVIGIWGWHRFGMDPIHPKLFVNMLTADGEAMIDITDKDGRKIVTNAISPINLLYLANEVNSIPFALDFLQGSLTWEDGRIYEPSYDIPARTFKHLITYPFLPPDENRVITAELVWETLKAENAPDGDTAA